MINCGYPWRSNISIRKSLVERRAFCRRLPTWRGRRLYYKITRTNWDSYSYTIKMRHKNNKETNNAMKLLEQIYTRCSGQARHKQTTAIARPLVIDLENWAVSRKIVGGTSFLRWMHSHSLLDTTVSVRARQISVFLNSVVVISWHMLNPCQHAWDARHPPTPQLSEPLSA